MNHVTSETVRENCILVNKKIRSNKGINMITLSIAVIILVIITSVLVYNAKDGVKVKTLSNMYNDIEALENKVSSYYLEHGDIPGHVVYANEVDGINSEFISMIDNEGARNPNDENMYLIIDLKVLEGVSLNYGRDYDQVSNNTDVTSLKDIYVINKISHTIYYPRGIEVEGKTYYTLQAEYSKVDKACIPIYTAQEMSWVGDGQPHSIAEEDGTEYTFALNGTYILKNDIDLSSVCSAELGENWTPIGTSSENAFSGIFYGNGHEIKNLYINITNSNNSQFGIFRYIKNATLQDFGVTGNISSANLSGPYTYLGGIAARAEEKCSIKNVYNKVNIYCSMTGYGSVGGILANSTGDVTMDNCYNSGHLIGGLHIGGTVGNVSDIIQIKGCYNTGQVEGGQYLGGILGYTGGSKIEIVNSYNDGIINGRYYTGGIVGRGSYVNGDCKICNCYNKKLITSSSTPTGGIIGGGISYWKIKNCYNSGEITANVASVSQIGGISGSSCKEIALCYNTGTINGSANGYCGGIQGYMDSSDTIENCYNIGEIKSEGSTGGIIGRNASSSTIKNCYSIGKQSKGGGISGWNQSSKIYNCFWLDTVATTLSGNGTNNLAKTSEQMKETAFIDLLETENEEFVWLQDTTNMNRGYPILKWQMEE